MTLRCSDSPGLPLIISNFGLMNSKRIFYLGGNKPELGILELSSSLSPWPFSQERNLFVSKNIEIIAIFPVKAII